MHNIVVDGINGTPTDHTVKVPESWKAVERSAANGIKFSSEYKHMQSKNIIQKRSRV